MMLSDVEGSEEQEMEEVMCKADGPGISGRAIVRRGMMRKALLLYTPEDSAVPRTRIRDFKIVREVPVLALVKRLRASAKRLQKAMDRWCEKRNGSRVIHEMLGKASRDDLTERMILTDEEVVARWNELCSRMTHLKIRDVGGMPIAAYGDQAHIDIMRDDLESDDSVEALVERMLLFHASSPLYLYWHACYAVENIYVSKEDFMRHGGVDMSFFDKQPRDSAFAIRAGYAESGAAVFEFVADQPCGTVNVFRWRAVRDDNDDFGVMRGIIKKFLSASVCMCEF